jgi:hypothetical protein
MTGYAYQTECDISVYAVAVVYAVVYSVVYGIIYDYVHIIKCVLYIRKILL